MKPPPFVLEVFPNATNYREYLEDFTSFNTGLAAVMGQEIMRIEFMTQRRVLVRTAPDGRNMLIELHESYGTTPGGRSEL